jgi:hypothetical protein
MNINSQSLKRFTYATIIFAPLALAMLALLAAPGCKPSQAGDTPSPEAQKLADAKQKSAEAVADLKDYAFAKKADFVKAMRAELDEARKEMNDLDSKMAVATNDVKTAAQPKMEALHAQVDKLKAELDEAEDATEANWSSVKEGAEKTYADLKKSCNDARQWLSEKIAPNPA